MYTDARRKSPRSRYSGMNSSEGVHRRDAPVGVVTARWQHRSRLAITLEHGCAAQTWARAPQPESVVLVGASLAVRWRAQPVADAPQSGSTTPVPITMVGVLVFGQSSSVGGRYSPGRCGPGSGRRYRWRTASDACQSADRVGSLPPVSGAFPL